VPPTDKLHKGMRLSAKDVTAQVPPTDNPEWGFAGTVRKGFEQLAERLWQAVGERLTQMGLTTEQARDALDSTLGRHLADALLDIISPGVHEGAQAIQLERFVKSIQRSHR
jgi:hypothetical protein